VIFYIIYHPSLILIMKENDCPLILWVMNDG